MMRFGCSVELFIHPGEYAFADGRFCIRTTLGSCVAIVLWHPERRIGGMCHFMLPRRKRTPGEALNGKYGEEAIELLFREARKRRTQPEDYEVKLFGGGDMFRVHEPRSRTIGNGNMGMARRLIAERGLRIKAESLGGVGYRNLIFDIAEGVVWVRHVISNDQLTPARSV